MTDPTAIDTTDGMRSYLDGMERLVRAVLTRALDQPQGTWRRRRLVNLRERHLWRTRNAEVVDWFGSRALAHMWIASGERGEFDSLVALAEADNGLWQAISGRPAEYPKRHAFHHVMEDLSGLVERYFATYPERRQIVERGVCDHPAENERHKQSLAGYVRIFPQWAAKGLRLPAALSSEAHRSNRRRMKGWCMRVSPTILIPGCSTR